MADRKPIVGASSADRSSIVPGSSRIRSRTTNAPAERLGRTAEARRVRDLYAGYLVALGDPVDVPTLALVLAAAEAVAIAEKARADYLSGRGDINSVVRAENTSNRSLRRLGLAKPAKAAKGKTFAEKMAEAEAARKAAGRTQADAAEGVEKASGADQRISANETEVAV